MKTLAVAALKERPDGLECSDQFQAAIYHHASVPPDGPPSPVVAGSPLPSACVPSTPGVRRPPLYSSGRIAECPPSTTQFRRPPAHTTPFLSSESQSLSSPAAVVLPGTSVGKPSATNAAGGTTKEPDLIYMQYCAVKNAEDARDLWAQQQGDHNEIKEMLVSLGQSMVNMTSTVQAHAACATVSSQWLSDRFLSISREHTAHRASLHAAPNLTAARTTKRQKTCLTSVVTRYVPDGPDRPHHGAAVDSSAQAMSSVRLDMLFSPVMEAELIEGRLTSLPLASQLERIVRLAHVSAGKPGLFVCAFTSAMVQKRPLWRALVHCHRASTRRSKSASITTSAKRRTRTYACCSGCEPFFPTCSRSERGRPLLRQWRSSA